jgi:hypothetical protein
LGEATPEGSESMRTMRFSKSPVTTGFSTARCAAEAACRAAPARYTR